MTKEQEVHRTSYEIGIEVPFVADQLSKGVDEEKWKYEQSIKNLEEEKENQEMVSESICSQEPLDVIWSHSRFSWM